MTKEEREEAIKRLKEILTEAVEYEDSVCYVTDEDREPLETAIKALEQEPCEDAISRQAVNTLIDELARAISDERCCISRGRSTATIMRDILHLPPVTPQPKIGRWIAYEVRLPDRTILNYRCSVCGRKLIGYNTETLSEAPFCHCGAKMQEAENG